MKPISWIFGACLLLMASFLRAAPAAAQTFDSEITIQFVTENGGSYVPFAIPGNSPNAAAYCMDENFEMSYLGAIASGQTSVTIAVPGGFGYYCEVMEVTGYGSGLQFVLVAESAHASLETVFLLIDASAAVTLVVEGGGTPVISTPGSVFCSSTEVPFGFLPIVIPPGQHSGVIDLVGGHSYTCTVSGITNYAGIYSATFFLGAGEKLKPVELELAPLEDRLTVHLSKSGGGDYEVGQGEYVYVNCQGPYYLSFNQRIAAGSSSADIDVLPGGYSCSVFVAGYAAQSGSVTVLPHMPAALTLLVIERSARVHVHLQDQNGEKVSALPDAQLSIWPRDAGIVDWNTAALSGGEATAAIAPDVPYRVLIFSGGGGCGRPVQGSDGKKYVIQCNSVSVQAAPNEVKDVPITVYEADAAVTVTVLDSEGAGMGEAYVQAVETSESAGAGYPLISMASTDASGKALLQLVSGRTFGVSALSGSHLLGMTPPPVEVALPPHETGAVTLQYQAVDFWLRITAEAGPLDHGSYYCYAFDDAGHIQVNEAGMALGRTLTLGLLRASLWHIGCSGTNENVYFSIDEFTYAPPADQSSDDIFIAWPGISAAAKAEPAALFHIDGDAFNVSAGISSSSGNSLSAPNGDEVEVPAGTLGEQGTLTLTNAAALAANAEYLPIAETGITVSARDGGGNNLSVVDGRTFTLKFMPSSEELGGIDPAEVRGARYDSSTGSYTMVPATLAQGAVFQYTLTAAALGTYVLLKPRSPSVAVPTPTPPTGAAPIKLPRAPKKAVLKFIKGRLSVSWRASGGGGKADSYEITVARGTRVIMRGTAGAASHSHRFSKRIGSGAYRLRIVAVNSAGSSPPLKKKFNLPASSVVR